MTTLSKLRQQRADLDALIAQAEAAGLSDDADVIPGMEQIAEAAIALLDGAIDGAEE